MLPGLTPRHEPPRLLLAVAHPDDETFGCGSLLLAAAAAGWATTVVCATRGEAGEPAPGVDLDGRSLAEVREEELREAAGLLGVARLELLDFADSGMSEGPPAGSLCAADPATVAAALRAVADEVDPDVVVSLDAADGHRDHARIRDAAVGVAGERGVPAYLQALPRSLMDRWVAHMVEARPDMEHLRYADLGTPDDEIAVVLDTATHLGARERAIAAHASQTSPFDGLPDDLRRAFLTREHLVRG
ncbi:PIG-L family deacetylase [Nocardioides sp. CGMCC 1.13656]|uniref:PIG-L deacetylase family protein n=1 Tax=Nocardioides TaxID=1839 RepID=UPI0012F8E196|nr:PIG-L deacetylase family protein [Nocardioides sp. CGMCC 1.13656]MBA2956200.1 PIG-L family deacetylase [Nocardioides sp. CGMCC 1.13656]